MTASEPVAPRAHPPRHATAASPRAADATATRDPAGAVDTRTLLLGALQRQPGATVAQLARAVGVDHSTATYHLDRLLRQGLVVVRRHGGRRHCFPADGAPADQRALAICARRGQSRLVLARLDGAPRRLAEVAHGLPLTKTGVQWHLRRLVALGLAVEEPGRGGRRYRRAPAHLALGDRRPAMMPARPPPSRYAGTGAPSLLHPPGPSTSSAPAEA